MKWLKPQSLKASYILLLLIMFVSCKKKDDDQLIKSQLVGTWKSTSGYYKSYTFNENGTFRDTTFYLDSNNPFDFKILEIITGQYNVDNGEINFSNIKLEYFMGQENVTISGRSHAYEPTYNISVQGDNLVLTQKDVFESINSSNSGIIGKWSHDKLVGVYDNSLPNKFTGGTIHGVYDFKPDLSVTWQFETSYDNKVTTGNSTTAYDLTDSKLNINQWSLYNLKVSFTKNKMIWIYDESTFQRRH
jgi:hypothetical protein